MDGRDDPAYSRAPEPDDLTRLCRALNAAAARYVLIGGFAVMAHGAGRYTKDIDLLIDDAPENVARVKQAMAILSDNAAADIADSISGGALSPFEDEAGPLMLQGDHGKVRFRNIVVTPGT